MKKTHKISYPIRIVYITTVPRSFNQLRGHLRYLGEQGFDIHCISSPGPELDIVAQRENVQIHPVLMHRSISPLHDLLTIIKIVLILIKLKPSIVHAGTPKGGFLGIIAAVLAGIPIRIYYILGFRYIGMKSWKRSVVYLADKIACLLANKIYCVSHSLHSLSTKLNLCPHSKISVRLNGSLNGVDAKERFNPKKLAGEGESIRKEICIPQNAIVIGFMGRIVKDKGFVELVQAWKQIRNKISNVHMLIVGPYELGDPVPLDVRNILESDSHIHLMGWVLNQDPYYAAMDIYVLPSYREGFPTTTLEAAAMELPVVATKIPGCIDSVVNGVTGTLVEVKDSVDLASALINYCENQKLRIEHGLNGRKRVLSDYQPEAIWELMVDEYFSMLERRNKYSRVIV